MVDEKKPMSLFKVDGSESEIAKSDGDKSKLKDEEEQDPEIEKMRKVFLRDFKISGKIGAPNQKDTLSFCSLMYQIQNGKVRGYSNKELIDGVMKSIIY